MKLTRFQTHILRVLRAISPADYDDIEKHCRQHRKAIRKAVYRLRSVGLVNRIEKMHDVTYQGRKYLSDKAAQPGELSNCRESKPINNILVTVDKQNF